MGSGVHFYHACGGNASHVEVIELSDSQRSAKRCDNGPVMELLVWSGNWTRREERALRSRYLTDFVDVEALEMPPAGSPRKSRKKPTSAQTNSARNDAVITDPQTGVLAPAFPLASFLWPARKSTSQWLVLPLVLMAVGLYRWCAGLWGYSGFQTPPMHGDYEAQRHWMEITKHLPTSQWYFYDLQYWGLDYPPLTAYHSWILGSIGSLIDPAWFALDSSRGIEQQLLKVYMRATVLVSEYFVYMPAVIIFDRRFTQQEGFNKWETSTALVALLMQPGTILIDHAHFQYNTVMLGLVVASFASLLSDRFVWASAFFVGALCFKQMALYFAPAMFAYLLGSCLVPKLDVLRFLRIALTTVLAFAVCFAPMILGALYDQHRGINPPLTIEDRQVNPLMAMMVPYVESSPLFYPAILQVTQVIHRSFPFARGIFEDKVANVWCAIHTIHKLHEYPTGILQRVSLLSTVIAILPACMLISLHPRKSLLPWAMASCAWGFFLFSFQVHEKSVLLPLLPTTLLLGSEGGLGVEMRAWIGFANTLGVWTMFPLLKRDELRFPYAILTLLWSYLLDLPPTSIGLYSPGKSRPKSSLSVQTKALHLTFYAMMLAWHIVEAFVEPPNGKPDLWVVINVLIGAAGFGICYLWCTWQLIARSGITEEYLSFRREQDSLGPAERRESPLLPWPSGSKEKPPVAKGKKSSPVQEKGRKEGQTLIATAVEVPREGSPRKSGRARKGVKN